MSQRFLTSMGVLAFGIAVMSLPAVPVSGQAPAAATKPGAPAKTAAPAKTTAAVKPYTAPKTPWGDPYLQGIWNDATSTPFQRPAALGEKGVLGEDEAD